ncbi:MAG: mannosyltransferase family protein [Acidimicrobiales bacterium]
MPWSNHPRPHHVPGRPWFEAWVHWDSEWYLQIANHGYSYKPGRQSSVAFFPLYPLAGLSWLERGGAVFPQVGGGFPALGAYYLPTSA